MTMIYNTSAVKIYNATAVKIYNARAVKIYNAMSSLPIVHFEKKIFSYFEKCYTQQQRWRCSF
jgi:hypothetical protein